MLRIPPVMLCVATAVILSVQAVSIAASADTNKAPAAGTGEESAQQSMGAVSKDFDEPAAEPAKEPACEEEDAKAAAEKDFDIEKPMVYGKTVYYADRGIILPLGTGEARVDLYVGLNKGEEGRVFGVGSGLASERNAGLTFRGGIWGPFEMGMSLQYLQSIDDAKNSRPRTNFDGTTNPATIYRGPEGDGTRRLAGYGYKLSDGFNHLVPGYLYGRFKVVDQFGVELGLLIPTMQANGYNRPALRFGFPVQWIAVPGLLKLHARPDLLLGFGTDAPEDPAMGDSVVNVAFYVDAGVTISVANLFFDVTVGYGLDVYPFKKGYLPLSFLVGYQVLTRLDVFAGVTLENLTPEYGAAGDARSITTGIQCRF